MANSFRAVFRVGGVSGDEGRKEIKHTLMQIDGVQGVDLPGDSNTVAVEFDPGVIGEDSIKRTLNSLGYSPFIYSGE